MRIEQLKQKYDLSVKWIHFPLHPDTPTEGRTLEALFAGRGMDVAAMQEQMRQRMQSEGLDYGQRTHTYNSRLAQELGAWADSQPGGDAIHDALYRAYFVDAKNIGDIDVLLEVTASVDLDVDEARRVLEERRFQEAVDAHWQKSAGYGVTGVPTFVAGGYGVVGAQPYEVLAELVSRAGAEKRE